MEEQLLVQKEINTATLQEKMREACKKIAPVWPLENFVAVNPYLGFTSRKFEATAKELAMVGGIQMTLPRSFYRKKIAEGKISLDDLGAAMHQVTGGGDIDPAAFIKKLDAANYSFTEGPSIASLIDVAANVTHKDWNRFVLTRISSWAASYFDNGQASWVVADQKAGIFKSWKAEAEVDFTPEINGLKKFRKAVAALPEDPITAAQRSLAELKLTEEDLEFYLHRLLVRVGGWAAYAARLDWDSELSGGKDGQLIEFLSVLICWEACLLKSLKSPELKKHWENAKKALANADLNAEEKNQLATKLILQQAFDRASQREFIAKFDAAAGKEYQKPQQTKAQAVFCIDVRSEVIRRNIEMVDQEIETLGFAGFFGFPINYVPIAHNKGEAQCPVLISPGPTVLETASEEEKTRDAVKHRMFKNQLSRVWKSFQKGAITCFSFVSPLGLSYMPKLFTDSFGISRPVPAPDRKGLKKEDLKNRKISLEVAQKGSLKVGIPMEQRIELAKNALTAMSLTKDFADFVLIVGHASTSVNNPHASGLDCGACGGRSGESNAKVAAMVLNDPQVRKALKAENIDIPDTTVFLSCLHDTTTDEITIFNEEEVSEGKKEKLEEVKNALTKAGKASRTERAVRFSLDENAEKEVMNRSKDWSQIRPEWGLAGCNAFVVASRERTKDIDLEGQSFLHSYNWKSDKDFAVLENIMTAPLIVTNWINMQYYASTVDNEHFGAGNKTLHNLTAGVGVLEGYSGDLRVGLPLQSVHDGEKYQHEPIRLNVVIEAPVEAMNRILEKHSSVKELCDNEWLYLMAMDEQGKISHRYTGNLSWEAL